jgi:hypothetical protein
MAPKADRTSNRDAPACVGVFLVVILSKAKDLRGAIPVCRRPAENDLPKRHRSIKHAQGRVAGGFSLFP